MVERGQVETERARVGVGLARRPLGGVVERRRRLDPAVQQPPEPSGVRDVLAPVREGDIALVHAAAGGLGQLLTQIIKLRGGQVIGRVSSEEKSEAARAAGADHVIVDRDGRFAGEAVRLSGGEGVNVVYDGSGPKTFQGSLDALRRSGTFCWYGPVLGAPEAIEVTNLPKSIKLGYAVFSDHISTPELLQSRTQQLFDWVLAGKLKVATPTEYPLADAGRAHAAMESRKSTGKLLLVP